MRELFHQVPVLDTGARGATNSFVQRDLGDVLIAWENEAWLAGKEFGAGTYAIVYPSLSISRRTAGRRGGQRGGHGSALRAPAQAYLEFLYTAPAQDIAARNYYRPSDPAVARQYAEHYPTLKLVTIKDFGGWDTAQARYFADGGLFDRIYTAGKMTTARRSALPGFRAGHGDHACWVSLIVLVPLASLALRPWELRLAGVWHSVTRTTRAGGTGTRSFGAAALAAAVNVCRSACWSPG